MEEMEGGLSPRPEIVENEAEVESQRTGAEATEAEAVQEASQGEGRKRSALERSPARGEAAAKLPRAADCSMEMEETGVAVEKWESGQQLFVEDRVGDRLGAGDDRTESPGGALDAGTQLAAAGEDSVNSRSQALESPGPDPSDQSDWVESVGRDREERRLVLAKARVAERVKPGCGGGVLWRSS